MVAARKGETEVVSLLVKAGASLDLQNKVNILILIFISRVSDQFSTTITSDSSFLCSGRARQNSGSGFR